MVFTFKKKVTAFWTCPILPWLALLGAEADMDFRWPWLCDAVTEHYDRLRRDGSPRNVLGFDTLVGNFSYVRIQNKLHINSCGEATTAAAIPVWIRGRLCVKNMMTCRLGLCAS